jgi:hypothetical protein
LLAGGVDTEEHRGVAEGASGNYLDQPDCRSAAQEFGGDSGGLAEMPVAPSGGEECWNVLRAEGGSPDGIPAGPGFAVDLGERPQERFKGVA